MSPADWTWAGVLCFAGIIIVWDIALAWRDKPTISEVITDKSKRHTMIAFAFGVLMGHWFW